MGVGMGLHFVCVNALEEFAQHVFDCCYCENHLEIES